LQQLQGFSVRILRVLRRSLSGMSAGFLRFVILTRPFTANSTRFAVNG